MTLPARPLTPAQLAERWQFDRETVYVMIARGEVRAFKVGAEWRISTVEVARIEGIGFNSTAASGISSGASPDAAPGANPPDEKIVPLRNPASKPGWPV